MYGNCFMKKILLFSCVLLLMLLTCDSDPFEQSENNMIQTTVTNDLQGTYMEAVISKPVDPTTSNTQNANETRQDDATLIIAATLSSAGLVVLVVAIFIFRRYKTARQDVHRSRTPNSVSVESQVESNLPEAYTSFTKQMGWDNKDDSPVNTLYKSDAGGQSNPNFCIEDTYYISHLERRTTDTTAPEAPKQISPAQ